MAVDWPLTFQGFKTFLEPLADASWPIVFGIAIWAFRRNIGGLIDRVRTLRGLGAEADLLPHPTLQAPAASLDDQTRLSDKNVIVTNPAGGKISRFPPANDLFGPVDQKLAEELNALFLEDNEAKFAWAVRLRTQSEIERIHEANYRLMWGSQLRALKLLNQFSQASVEKFEPFYIEAKESELGKQILVDTDFERWGRFLVNAGYVFLDETSDPETVTISSLGKDFLVWMAGRGISDYRPL